MLLSVLICAHNPRPDYLQRVLNALEAQTLSLDQWELILIDNASKEVLSTKWDLSWHPNARIVVESELGLTHARLRSIREATTDLLVFVDDDNVLAPDYLAEAMRIADAWPMLGAWGGQQFPEFEHGTPEEAWKIEFWTGKLERDLWSNNYDRNTAPSGSGLCVRRVVASRYAELAQTDGLRLNLGRKGAGLNAAEDIDMDYVACDLDLGMGRFRSLHLTHLIPATRLSDEYLFRLCEGFGYSETILEALRGDPPDRPCRIDRLVAGYKCLRTAGRQSVDQKARNKGRERAFLILDAHRHQSSR
jgi:glycosyltransferase involved in cell wall biosynthesis